MLDYRLHNMIGLSLSSKSVCSFSGTLNYGQRAVESTTLLQKYPSLRSNRLIPKIYGIPKQSLQEGDTKASRSRLFAHRLKTGGAGGSEQLTSDGRPGVEVFANERVMKAGCERETHLRFLPEAMIGEFPEESTDTAGGIRVTTSMSGELVRQRRAQRLEVPGESRVVRSEETTEVGM